MNREIKFRAWDTLLKVMLRDEQLHDGEYDTWPMLYHVLTNKNYVPLQFTGLKDKAHWNIYEGDIGQDGTGDRFEVKFDEGKFVAVHGGNVIEDLCEVAKDFEVIGNIYENPELLNEEKQ